MAVDLLEDTQKVQINFDPVANSSVTPMIPELTTFEPLEELSQTKKSMALRNSFLGILSAITLAISVAYTHNNYVQAALKLTNNTLPNYPTNGFVEPHTNLQAIRASLDSITHPRLNDIKNELIALAESHPGMSRLNVFFASFIDNILRQQELMNNNNIDPDAVIATIRNEYVDLQISIVMYTILGSEDYLSPQDKAAIVANGTSGLIFRADPILNSVVDYVSNHLNEPISKQGIIWLFITESYRNNEYSYSVNGLDGRAISDLINFYCANFEEDPFCLEG